MSHSKHMFDLCRGGEGRKCSWKPHAVWVLLTALNCLASVELLEAPWRPALSPWVPFPPLGHVALGNSDNNQKVIRSCLFFSSSPGLYHIKELRFREMKSLVQGHGIGAGTWVKIPVCPSHISQKCLTSATAGTPQALAAPGLPTAVSWPPSSCQRLCLWAWSLAFPSFSEV